MPQARKNNGERVLLTQSLRPVAAQKALAIKIAKAIAEIESCKENGHDENSFWKSLMWVV